MKINSNFIWLFGMSTAVAGLIGTGCAPKTEEGTAGGSSTTTAEGGASTGSSALSGKIIIDGSSTVFPISEAVAEEFMKKNPSVQVSVAQSGTGGGFKKFTKGETDISNASRPIEGKEIEAAKAGSVDFIEIPVAYDGLSVVINPKNTWVDHLTVEELKKIWEPESTVKTWADVRAGWPAKPIKLYGPGTDSGTFDYFTKSIVGKEKASRSDYQASEDDNTLVTGVAGDEGALGYFGFAYYIENKDKLKVVPIDAGKGPVEPSMQTIEDGTYTPLSRPEFIYVSAKVADRPEVKAFIEFHLGSEGRALVKEVGYVPLPDKAYELGLKRFMDKKMGSIFSAGMTPGTKIDEFMSKE